MNDRRPTDLELATALRAHLPAVARGDLAARVAAGVADTRQQRAWPSLVGALTDADPMVRRRSLLLAVATLLVLALAGVALAGAWRVWRSDSVPGAQGLFAFVRGGDLYMASADGRDAVLVAHVDGSELSGPKWSADGLWLAVQTPEPAILGLDLRTMELRRLATGRLAAWSPVVPTLAYYTPAGQIALLDVDRGDSRILAEPPAGSEGYPGYGSELAWSPDGSQLSITGLDGDPPVLMRIDASTGVGTIVATSTECCAFRQSWAPDASRIAYSMWRERGSSEGFWVTDVDGAESIKIRDPDGDAADPTWSPDGAWIAYHVVHWDGEIRTDRVMLVRPDGSDRRLLASVSQGPEGRPQKLEDVVGWSDDGSSIAYTVLAESVPEGEAERRELHLVAVADGADRVLPALGDGRDIARRVPPGDGQAELAHLALPAPMMTAVPDTRAEEPAAGGPVRPEASWGGLAFRVQEGESDCLVAVYRFPDTVTELPAPFGPPPTEAPPATPPAPGASAPPQPAAEYCEFSFAPDGSAFMATSQAHRSFELVRSDGTRLSGPFPNQGGMPTWSPGGTWVAGEDWLMRADGSVRRALPGRPSWSPDEQVLAVQGQDGTLLVGRSDGSELRPIGAFPLPASWSPDGSTFAFVRDGDAWLAAANGTRIRNLSDFPLGGVTGTWWSPDGHWIAVLQGTTMWVVSADGSIRHRIASHLGQTSGSWGIEPTWAPVWSSDGAWLAIEHDDPMRDVGSQAQEVTLVHSGDWQTVRVSDAAQPRWSADGRHLAVVSVSDGYGIDVMNADGSGRLAAGDDRLPAGCLGPLTREVPVCLSRPRRRDRSGARSPRACAARNGSRRRCRAPSARAGRG